MFFPALQFNSVLLGPALVSGVVQAGLYGLLAVGLVLTFRVSRTVAFVNGGLAMFGAMGMWWLTSDSVNYTGPLPLLPVPLGMLIVTASGVILGGVYGKVVTSRRLADWPKVTLTTFSLGLMLILLAAVPLIWPAELGGAERPASPFGTGSFFVFGTNVSVHEAMTLGLTAAVVALLALVTKHTRGGVYLRAIADDVEASRWVGVPINTVGTAVYAVVGALSMLAGALIATQLGPDFNDVLFVFLRALTAAVLGGFNSFFLALGGSLLFGVVDSAMRTGLLGETTAGQRELLTAASVFVLILVITRHRRDLIEVLDAEGM